MISLEDLGMEQKLMMSVCFLVSWCVFSLDGAFSWCVSPPSWCAFALDGAFAVRGVRVMEDKNGHNFVAFPSRAKADGTYEDLAFPLSKDLYAHITGAILDEYKVQVPIVYNK